MKEWNASSNLQITVATPEKLSSGGWILQHIQEQWIQRPVLFESHGFNENLFTWAGPPPSEDFLSAKSILYTQNT